MTNEPANITVNGLGTFSFSVLSTGYKTLKGKITLPSIIEGAPVNSQVVVTININGGSAIYTGAAGAEGFESGSYATAGQVFNVILSSSLPQDEQLVAVKSTISFY
jgi:hypothetical protein